MNNSFTILASAFLVGFVGYKTLSRNTDIHFEKVDKKIKLEPIIEEKDDELIKSLYDEQLNKLSRELVDDMIRQVCIELNDEYESNSMSYDICSICSTCSSFIDVEVD